MLVQLGRLFCVDAIRCVDDLAFDSELAHIVKVSGYGRTLGLLRAPTKLSRYDLRKASNPHGMPFRILILTIDRGGKRTNGVVICRPHLIEQASILICLAFDLGHEISLCYRDTDVPA